jgi:hypothetical protein
MNKRGLISALFLTSLFVSFVQAEYFERARAGKPHNTSPAARPFQTITFRATSRGFNAQEFAFQNGVARFFKDGVLFYEKTGGGGGGRGFNIAAIDANTGEVMQPVRNFDTWGTRTSGTAMNEMIAYLNGLPNGTLVMIAVADDAGLNIDNSCARLNFPWVENGIQALEALGSTKIRDYCFRFSYAMIAVKGEGLAREERVMDAIEVAAQTTISTTSNQSLAFSSSTYTTGEGGPAYVKVNRTGGSSGTVSVNYSMANISATAGTDYTATSDILSFASGEVTKLISIPIINDTATESNETFSITLSNPAGGATLGTPATATVTIVDDDTPTASGQWGPVINWPVVPIHIHLLPTGKVMFWDRHTGSSDSMKTWAWDPVTQAVTELASPGYDIFCSGHTFMADGKLIVTGGHHMADNVGENTASVYDPVADSWISLPNMNAGRWYPTNTTLANGDILVMAGTINAFNDVNLIPQVWQTASNSWRYLTGAAFLDHAPAWPDYYPFNYVAPNGKVFNAGPQQTSRYLDTTGTGTWSDVANSSLSYRDYGSSVMYADGKVLIVGGNPRFPTDPNVLPSATAEVIDLNSANPAWRSIAPMSVGRRHLNTTLLPDGKVLVTGGSSFYGHNDPSGKVLYAEMWDPQTEAWAPMAGHRQYRGYHSNALLLPDGRVLIAGGGHPDPPTGAEPNAEIYSPPYIFKGARPVITSAPAQVGYGQTFFVETPGAQNIAKVTWIRLSSVTHAFNENQRINQLSFSQATGGLMVTAPSGANLCPPGDYMLFILNSTGVPSIARIVRIGTSSPNYAGFLEVGDCNTISGWAADRNRLNTSITVSIYDGNTLVTTVTANQSRPDVGNFLGDNGLHGFSIATPASLKNGQPHTVRVKFESSSTELNNSPKTINCLSSFLRLTTRGDYSALSWLTREPPW